VIDVQVAYVTQSMHKLRRDEHIEEDILIELLHRAQKQADPAAFDGLYLLYADRIYYYIANRVRNHEIAEDLTAQVFLHLVEKISHYEIAPQDNVPIFSAWLFRITYNKLIDAVRSKQRVQHVDLVYVESFVASYPIEKVEERLDFEAVLHKLKHLNDEQRRVILLRYVEDLSISETAEIMGKSEGAVKALRYRALENLRRHLQA
jgi:RNA polymerase sigma-70 factor, ECF subfamily